MTQENVHDVELLLEKKQHENVDNHTEEVKECTCITHDRIDNLVSGTERLVEFKKGVSNATQFFISQIPLQTEDNIGYLEKLTDKMYEMHLKRAMEVSQRELLNLTRRRNKVNFVPVYRCLCADGREGAPKESKLPKANDNNVFRSPAGYPSGYFDKEGKYNIDATFKEKIIKEAKKGPFFYYRAVVHQGCAAMKLYEQQIVEDTNVPKMDDGGLYRDIVSKASFLEEMESTVKQTGKEVEFKEKIKNKAGKLVEVNAKVPTKRFLHSFITNITGNGSIYLGLELDQNKKVAQEGNRGYNDEVLKHLVDDGKVLSTYEMVQTDIGLNKIFAEMIRAYKEHVLKDKKRSLDFKENAWLESTKMSQNITLSFLLPKDDETRIFMRQLYPKDTCSEKEFQEKLKGMIAIMKNISDKLVQLYPQYEGASFSKLKNYLAEVILDPAINPVLKQHLEKILTSCRSRRNQDTSNLLITALSDPELSDDDKSYVNELIEDYTKMCVFEDLKKKVLENCFSIYLQNPAARQKEVEKMRLHAQHEESEGDSNFKALLYPYDFGAHKENVVYHSGDMTRNETYGEQRFSLGDVKPGEMNIFKGLQLGNRTHGRVNDMGIPGLHSTPEKYSYVHYVAETIPETFQKSDWGALNNDSKALHELREGWRRMSSDEMKMYLEDRFANVLSKKSIEAILRLHKKMLDLYNNPGVIRDDLMTGEIVALPVINDCYGRILTMLPFISGAKAISKQ